MTPTPPDEVRLPRQPGVVRRFWAHHPRLTDWFIAVFWGAPALGLTLAAQADAHQLRTFASLIEAGFVLVACIGFFIRRSHPVIALCVLTLAIVPAPFTDASPQHLVPIFGIYNLAVYRSTSAAWVAAAALETVSTAYAWRTAPLSSAQTFAWDPSHWALAYALELLIALAIGATIGNRRRYLAALIDRAHQLANERDQRARLAVAEERARIARDMHDLVSHSLTVMVALAEGAAASTATNSERAATVMRQVAETGRGALTGMRSMLGVLGGDESASLAPQPSAADLPSLVLQFRSLDLPVELSVNGVLPEDRARQLAVYRIVQEGLTNALRYAHGPTYVRVRVAADSESFTVVVEDDGLPGMRTPSIGAGRGVIGLTERVASLGGSLTAGPRTDAAGWRIAAALPMPAADTTEEGP